MKSVVTANWREFQSLAEKQGLSLGFLDVFISFYRRRFPPEARFDHTTTSHSSPLLTPPPPHWRWSFISGPSTCRLHSA